MMWGLLALVHGDSRFRHLSRTMHGMQAWQVGIRSSDTACPHVSLQMSRNGVYGQWIAAARRVGSFRHAGNWKQDDAIKGRVRSPTAVTQQI